MCSKKEYRKRPEARNRLSRARGGCMNYFSNNNSALDIALVILETAIQI